MAEEPLIVGPIKAETIDVQKHVGKKVNIASYSIEPSSINDGEYYIRVETEPVEVIPSKNGDDIRLRGSRLFNLKNTTDSEGKAVVGWAEGGPLDQFMKKYQCTVLDELVGKKVILTLVTSKKDGKEYLGIA